MKWTTLLGASLLALAVAACGGPAHEPMPEAEAEATGTGDAGAAVGPRTRRTPSAFANALQDHFPHGNGVAAEVVAVR